MNETRARALARQFIDTWMDVAHRDLGGRPVAACSRATFEALLTQLLQNVAAEASSPLGLVLEKLARLDNAVGDS